MPHRKPLFETLVQQVAGSYTTIVAIAIGAITLYFIYKKNQRTPRPPPGGSAPQGPPSQRNNHNNVVRATPQTAVPKKSEPDNVLSRIKNQGFVGSKICIEWEAVYEGESWKEKGKEVLEFYANTSDVYLMCHISQGEEKKKILDLVRTIQGLRRYKVLFSTTEKGYEAFTRQINPALLITHDLKLAELLSRVLPYIALVQGGAITKDNVACFNSVGDLLC